MVNDAQSSGVQLIDLIEDFIFKLTKTAVDEHIKKAGNFTVGFCSRYQGAANFHPDITTDYGLKILNVDGDDEEFVVQIECESYLGEELKSLGYQRDFYLIINNNSGKTWSTFKDKLDINRQFINAQIFKNGNKIDKFLDLENVIDNLNKATFMQKLGA